MFSKFIYLIFYFSIVCSQEFTYDEQNIWDRLFTNCGGNRQSPININTNRLRRNPNMRLNVESYETPHRNVVFRNTGHTVELTLKTRNPTMSIRTNGETYIFQNMHIHWGDNNFKGTEHSIDNSFGSAEIHFVHFNQKYGSFSSASNQRDGLVVVTVLSQLSRENNRAFEPIIRALPQVINANSTTVMPRFNFGRLLPRNTQLFFKYMGSLTTPPCSQTVTFMIFTDPIRISALQLSQFRRLFEDSNRKIISNTRNLQPINGRVVEVSVPGVGLKSRPQQLQSIPIAEPTFNELGDSETPFEYDF